jgi:transcription-repair coupling factor (superfamily II helicase)
VNLFSSGAEEAPAAGHGFVLSAFLRKHKGKTILVCPDESTARRLAEEIRFFTGRGMFLPSRQVIAYEQVRVSRDVENERRLAFHALRDDPGAIVLTVPETLLEHLYPADMSGDEHSLDLRVEQEISPDDLARRLTDLGYEAVERTELPGEFTKKGGLMDIFPPGLDSPVRIDFFDVLIESIRPFNAETQMGSDVRFKSVRIDAGCETVLTASESESLRKKMAASAKGLELPPWADSELGSLNSRDCESLHEYLPLIEAGVTLYDLHKTSTWIFVDREKIQERLEMAKREIEECYNRHKTVYLCISPERVFHLQGAGGIKALDLVSSQIAGSNGIHAIEGVKGRIAEIQKAVLSIVDGGDQVFVTALDGAQLERISGVFKTEKRLKAKTVESFVLPKNQPVGLLVAPLREGIRIPALNVQILTDGDLFGRTYKKKSFFKRRKSSPIESFLDLKEGDVVVHVNHGIGRFLKLERVTAAGRERDFLILEYADNDRLYVPLDQISMVQRYSAPTDNPRLDSLGKASFKKVRDRVQQRTEELAEELVKIYSARMAARGFSFPPDTIWQDEFEAAFEWEETPDQLSAIEAVKQDMESPRPMDRLVCGDVGYGKTEVAIRAAFKAVMAGKQVAFICPTTVLAMQHYRTLAKRFANYPIRVDWLSRFRTTGESNAVKEKLKKGDLDVVVGTHSLLAADVSFKNLGLLIIDEEQRFGVAHKEAVKKMRVLVDVLTLSATPIPRTLHMSLAGIRDLSIIQTPPRNRLPVMTHVMEDSDQIFKEAIDRELDRGGQVFYLHNRIDSIERAAARVRASIKDVSVGVLHGRMDDEDVENILLDFLDRKYHVLVTTSIIENGIDMPTVNTLLVDDSDHFGLSQLYQLRGRVGRSDLQAYAYFFCSDRRTLNETAQKRLNTLLEYQELGSGFKVAMRDLEIRGAGNILGKEQSGDIMDVGFEMYIKLLEEAVARVRGEEHKIDVHTSINLRTDMYLPENYIPDTRQRIEFYKRFEGAVSEAEVDELLVELQDRFGPAPELVETFVALERIRVLASACGFESIYQEDSGRVQLKPSNYFRVPGPRLIQVLEKKLGFHIQAGNPGILYYQSKGSLLASLARDLRHLVPPERLAPAG